MLNMKKWEDVAKVPSKEMLSKVLDINIKTNFFSFASSYISGGNLDTKGFLNDERATLSFEEINYFKEKE